MIDFDLDEFLERERRRVAALNTGSRHYVAGHARYDGARTDAESPLARPELRWPSQRALVPARCWNCNASSANFEHRPPYGFTKTGETVCTPCGRVIVRWRSDGTREIVDRLKAAQAELPPRGPVSMSEIHQRRRALVAILSDGELHPARDLMVQLNLSPDQLRRVIEQARSRGHVIHRSRMLGVHMEVRR